MKLIKIHSFLLVFATYAANSASAQLFIDNSAQFTIQTGAVVTVQGDVTSNADILGTGLLQMKGAALQNINMNGFTIPNLEIDNTSNVTLTGIASISGNLLFTNGKILLGANDLKMGTAGTITNATNAKYIVTNGAGKLSKAALSAVAFIFPVGKSTSSYTPVSISNSGTADVIGVRSLASVLTSGTTGTAFTKEVVNNTWDVSESVAGGSVLSMSTTWSSTDELAGFDRTRAGISYYITTPANNVGWDLLNSQTGTASGSNPYTYTRTNVTTLGTFAVGTRPVLSPLLFSPKIFLQGPYNTSLGLMGDNLRTANLLPVTEPYSTITGYITPVLRGSGGGETSASGVVGSAAGVSTNSTIVDWVMAQLHNGAGTVVTQRAVLLRRDGMLVETDGVSPVNFAGNAASAGPYFVSIKHRNHLGIRTTSTLALAKVTTTAYDFTAALSNAYGGAVSNDAMATLSVGVYGMWGGNTNSDLFSRKTGSATINDYSKLLVAVSSVGAPGPTGVYFAEDINMDGNVRKTGSASTNDYSRLLSILGSLNIISQPSF
ncbi:hypothetical protein BH11BAC3_BH11BAC3_10660 [soil metagenome]